MQMNLNRSSMALGLGLSLIMLGAGLTGCVNEKPSSSLKHSPAYEKPTWSGDEHTPPVYTSPTAPASTNLPAGNSPP